MDNVTTAVSPDENISEEVLDTRAVPLERLADDDEVLREVAAITAEPTRVPVAMFGSSI